MERILPKFLVMLVFGIWIFSPSPTNAQSLSSDAKFICGTANGVSKIAHCNFQVPADTIGTKLTIQIPKDKAKQVTNLKKGDAVSASGIFFHIEADNAGALIALRVDFADLKAVASGNTPYILFQFDLELVRVAPASFPVTINALLKVDSEFHTPISLSQSIPAFKALTDVILPITIASVQGAPAPDEVDSSFKFAGDEPPEPAALPADFYCFADPHESVSIAEWTTICDAKARGIISGNLQPNGSFFFFPNQSINRAEAVKIVTLGILRSLGKLNDTDFSNKEAGLRAAATSQKTIGYPDITYEPNGLPPWFAVYVSLATDAGIVGGYPDKTYKPANRISNAESYRVIGETGRVASPAIAEALAEAVLKTKDLDWFRKYVELLGHYKIPISRDYAEDTTRKEFLIIVMNLLKAVGL